MEINITTLGELRRFTTRYDLPENEQEYLDDLIDGLLDLPVDRDESEYPLDRPFDVLDENGIRHKNIRVQWCYWLKNEYHHAWCLVLSIRSAILSEDPSKYKLVPPAAIDTIREEATMSPVAYCQTKEIDPFGEGCDYASYCEPFAADLVDRAYKQGRKDAIEDCVKINHCKEME